jgi:ubiquinone/menaquinone biosynthesis C-methylase UbiE
MIAYIFLSLTDYPFFRRLIWKPIYENLAKRFKTEGWHFMNYGYQPSEHEPSLALQPCDEVNRYSIQLYHYLASRIQLNGLEILEVGSGRGGGANFVKKYHCPHKVIGIDIAHNAVKLSRQMHSTEGLYFFQGNAERIPFPDETFDAVLNVESCHAYGSVPAFLKEVKRVLKPGGYFLCTDMRSPEGLQTLRNNLLKSGLEILEEENVSMNVIRAIEYEEPSKEERIKKNIPKWLQQTFREFAGVKGSKIHRDLCEGSLVYYRFILKKI